MALNLPNAVNQPKPNHKLDKLERRSRLSVHSVIAGYSLSKTSEKAQQFTNTKLIEESEKRLSGMINKTHVGLVLIDKHGHIHDINLMAKNYFSLSDSMISNIKAWQLFEAGNPNSTTLQLLQNLEQHQELAEITSVETMARRSDGSYFPVLFSISAFPWHATTYYLCTVIDISKRKKQKLQCKMLIKRFNYV